MAATWRTSLPDTIALIQKQTTTMSLGGTTRVAVEMVGWAPILLDRWEFDAMGGKTKEADHCRRAIGIRSLAHELRIAVDMKDTIAPEDIGDVPRVVQELSQLARDEVSYLTRLAEGADTAHQRRYQLTRDNMTREVEAAADSCRQHEIALDIVAPPASAPAAASAKGHQAASSLMSSASGAYSRTKETVEDTPLWKTALVIVLFLGAVAIAAYNLRPKPDGRVILDAAKYRDVLPVVEMWKKDSTVCGVVAESWYRMPRKDQEARLQAAFEKLSKEHGATAVTLYRQGGRYLAAAAKADGIVIRESGG